MQVNPAMQQQSALPWLQYPRDQAFGLVLQQLDPCSLACTAVTCSKLRHAVPAAVRRLIVCLSTPETLDSFNNWLAQHSSSLTDLINCSIVGGLEIPAHVRSLTCPLLRMLHLQYIDMQLEPLAGCPGMLLACTGLAALDLQDFVVRDAHAAAAALAALPELRSLKLGSQARAPDSSNDDDPAGSLVLAELQFPLKLTHLSLVRSEGCFWAREVAQLSQLSGLVNLQHLELTGLFNAEGLPGGLPSQLVQLTCLVLHFNQYSMCNMAPQLQHLSSLTALQQLSLKSEHLTTSDVSGLQHLAQLTKVGLDSSALGISNSRISTWACITTVQSLALNGCRMQPQALTAFTQLRALSLEDIQYSGNASLGALLGAVGQLSLLTELTFEPSWSGLQEAPPPAAAFTALTASTDLCSLQLSLWGSDTPEGWVMFLPGAVYPRLRVIDLTYERHRGNIDTLPVREQLLQQLCRCCPAVDTLQFALCEDASPTALLPLLQLSALTRLGVDTLGAYNAVKGLAGVAAQLTGLKHLVLEGLLCLADSALLHLTALTALEELTLQNTKERRKSLRSKACWGSPPDIWMQLPGFIEALLAVDLETSSDKEKA